MRARRLILTQNETLILTKTAIANINKGRFSELACFRCYSVKMMLCLAYKKLSDYSGGLKIWSLVLEHTLTGAEGFLTVTLGVVALKAPLNPW